MGRFLKLGPCWEPEKRRHPYKKRCAKHTNRHPVLVSVWGLGFRVQGLGFFFASNIPTLQTIFLTGVTAVGLPVHVTTHECSIQVSRRSMGSHH